MGLLGINAAKAEAEDIALKTDLRGAQWKLDAAGGLEGAAWTGRIECLQDEDNGLQVLRSAAQPGLDLEAAICFPGQNAFKTEGVLTGLGRWPGLLAAAAAKGQKPEEDGEQKGRSSSCRHSCSPIAASRRR